MKNTIDLSIIIPSVSPQTWPSIIEALSFATGPLITEVIAVGPHLPNADLESNKSFRFIRDFGSPARSFQLATTIANGRYVTWIPDDAIPIRNGIYAQCVAFMDEVAPNNAMNLLYSEGPGYSGVQHLDPEYWIARTHAGLRFPLVRDEWKIAPIFMYNLEFFRSIGGLDCRYEHINMNTHDLAFRVQRNGGTVYNSPSRVMALNWKPWGETNKGPIQVSFEENDAPLFSKMFSSESEMNPYKIDYNNWMKADAFWKRRYP